MFKIKITALRDTDRLLEVAGHEAIRPAPIVNGFKNWRHWMPYNNRVKEFKHYKRFLKAIDRMIASALDDGYEYQGITDGYMIFSK